MSFTPIRFGADYANTGTAGPPVGAPWGGGGLATYPQTVGGLTIGVNDGIDGVPVNGATGWGSGDDVLCAGFWRTPNSTVRSWRVDLAPLGGPGDYRIILGVVAHGYQYSRWRVNDGPGGTNLIDVSWTGDMAAAWNDLAPANTDQFLTLDTAGTGIINAGAIDAGVMTPALQYATRTVTATALEIMLGGHASGSFSSDLSFIALERVTATLARGFHVLMAHG